jgi:hypothetical protein
LSEPSKRRTSASRSRPGGLVPKIGVRRRPPRPHHQAELVDQAIGQQVVPEGPAAEDQDLPAVPALELGDRLVGVGPADDGRGGPPGAGLVLGEAVGDDHLVDGVVTAADLADHRAGVGVVGLRRPVPLEPPIGPGPDQQGVGGPETFGVVGVEGLVQRHDHEVPAGSVVVAVERHEVADNEPAHEISSLRRLRAGGEPELIAPGEVPREHRSGGAGPGRETRPAPRPGRPAGRPRSPR